MRGADASSKPKALIRVTSSSNVSLSTRMVAGGGKKRLRDLGEVPWVDRLRPRFFRLHRLAQALLAWLVFAILAALVFATATIVIWWPR